MKKIVMTFLTALAAGCADHTMPVAQLPEIDTNNPLLAEWNTPHETPPFDRIRVSDYEPAFDAAIAVSRAEIDAIVNNPAKPTFNNTIVALDRQGRLLSRVEGIFFQPARSGCYARDAAGGRERTAQIDGPVQRHIAQPAALRACEGRL